MTGMVPPPPNYPPMIPAVPAPPARPDTTKARAIKRQQRRTPRPAPRARAQHPRLRVFAYNASAAACGWWCGLGPWALNGMTHYGTGDTPRGVWVGVGLTLTSLVAEWRTHHWRGTDRALLVQAAGWAGRIPLATTLLALALYGPDATL